MTMCFPEKCYIQMLDWAGNYNHQAELPKEFHKEIKFIWVDLCYTTASPHIPDIPTQLDQKEKN